MPDGASDPRKDGLQSALDFTKFALAIAGAAIIFLLGSDHLRLLKSPLARWEVTLALFFFGLSSVGGILVLMQGASKLANAAYGLDDWIIRVPGIINVISLLLGFLFTTAFVISVVWQ